MKHTGKKKNGRLSDGVNISLSPQLREYFDSRVESLKQISSPVRIKSASHYVQELIILDMNFHLLENPPAKHNPTAHDPQPAVDASIEREITKVTAPKTKTSPRHGPGTAQ